MSAPRRSKSGKFLRGQRPRSPLTAPALPIEPPEPYRSPVRLPPPLSPNQRAALTGERRHSTVLDAIRADMQRTRDYLNRCLDVLERGNY